MMLPTVEWQPPSASTGYVLMVVSSFGWLDQYWEIAQQVDLGSDLEVVAVMPSDGRGLVPALGLAPAEPGPSPDAPHDLADLLREADLGNPHSIVVLAGDTDLVRDGTNARVIAIDSSAPPAGTLSLECSMNQSSRVHDEPKLRSKNLTYDPVRPGDIDAIYELGVQGTNWTRWIFRGGNVSPSDVAARVFQPGVLTQMVARSQANPAIGAHLIAYEAQRNHAKVGIVASEAWQMTGKPVEAMWFFMDFVFGNWPFRKLYVEMMGSEWDRQHSLRRVFEVEGRLSEHEYFNGRFDDLIIGACTRQRFFRETADLRARYSALES